MMVDFTKSYVECQFPDGSGRIHESWMGAFSTVPSIGEYVEPSLLTNPERCSLRQGSEFSPHFNVPPVNTDAPIRYAFIKTSRKCAKTDSDLAFMVETEFKRFVNFYAQGLPVPFPVGILHQKMNSPMSITTSHLLLTEYQGCDTLASVINHNHLRERLFSSDEYIIARAKFINADHYVLLLRQEIDHIFSRKEKYYFFTGRIRCPLFQEYQRAEKQRKEAQENLSQMEHEKEKKVSLTDPECATIIQNAAQSLRQFAKKGVFLNDIAPRQIVVKPNLDIRFVDFEDTIEIGRPLSLTERMNQLWLLDDNTDWELEDRKLFEKVYTH